MIEVEQLTKHYGSREAVSNVSFRVEKGQVVGFLGPNGAGKSTTLRMITGFLKPTAGRIEVGGLDAATASLEVRRLIGYMPEGVPLYPEMRVSEYLLHRAELKGVGRKVRRKAMHRALEQAGVVEAAERLIGQLSKGFRQRVGLADALIADPPLLILDEPTAGLDPNQIREVRALIRGFGGEKTVFLSTHILPEVEASCERVVIIDRGRKVGEGSPEELRTALAGQGNQRLLLQGRGEQRAFRDALEAVEGVVEIERVDELGASGIVEIVLRTGPSETIAEEVFRAVADAELTLRRLVPQSASLEEVFAGLTTVEHGDEQDGRSATPDVRSSAELGESAKGDSGDPSGGDVEEPAPAERSEADPEPEKHTESAPDSPGDENEEGDR